MLPITKLNIVKSRELPPLLHTSVMPAWSIRHRLRSARLVRVERQRGVLLLWVALMLAIVAALAYVGNHAAALAAHEADAARDARVAGYLSEAAAARMRWAGDHSHCALPSPFSDTLAGMGSYAANLQQNAGSPLTVTVRASGTPLDASAATPTGANRNLLRPSVYLHQDPVTTAPLTPFPTQQGDTFISNRNPGQSKRNQSGGNSISVDASANLRALVRFDVSAIPLHASIVSASLNLYRTNANAGSSGIVSVHQLRTGWDFDRVTWRTTDGNTPWQRAGGDFDAINLASTASSVVGPGAGNHRWDLAPDLIDGWVNRASTQPNLGLILVADSSTGWIDFASVSGGGPGATLTISYQGPCP